MVLPGQQERTGLILSLLRDMQYDAVGVGENEISLGRQFYEEAEKSKLTILDAAPDAPETAVPYVVKDLGGVRVGIFSFGAQRQNEGTNEYERRKALYGSYAAVRQKADILVVLDQGNVVSSEWLEGIGKRLGAPDVVVSGNQKTGLGQPEVIGKTYICPTSIQGKSVGVVDVEFVRGSDPRIAWSRVELDDKIAEDENVKAKIDAVIRPGAGASAQVQPPVSQPVPIPTAPGGKPYYSPGLCKACHAKEYEDWASTKHAAAVKTLMDANRMVPECLPCHSEQYRRIKTVSINPDGIGGIECATCHMDALPHGMERKDSPARTRVNAMGCLECHTKERSAGYDEQVYFPKVSHLSVRESPSGAVAP